jgi:predicted nucleotidyltransferase
MGDMDRDLPVDFSPDGLATICRRYRVRRLSAFGSVLRDDFTDGSDIDLLVEFEPGRTPGFAFFRLEDELTEPLPPGRPQHQSVLSPHFRDRVLYEARALYVAA